MPEIWNEEQRLRNPRPFPDHYIHKLIQPIPNENALGAFLNDLVLCWRNHGAPGPDQIRHTAITTNINNATCPECRGLWFEGIYA